MDERKYVVVLLGQGTHQPVGDVYGPYDLIETAEAVQDDLTRLNIASVVKEGLCYWRVGNKLM